MRRHFGGKGEKRILSPSCKVEKQNGVEGAEAHGFGKGSEVGWATKRKKKKLIFGGES